MWLIEIFLVQLSRSGKVRMEIGGVSFCVDQGCDTFFQQDDMTLCYKGMLWHVQIAFVQTVMCQDLALVCPLAGEIFNLGNVNTRRGTMGLI